MILIILSMLLWQVNKGGSDIWLAFWSQKENQETSETSTKWVFFGVYSAFGVASCIFIFFRLFLLSRGTIRLGRKLHYDMLEKLIKLQSIYSMKQFQEDKYLIVFQRT